MNNKSKREARSNRQRSKARRNKLIWGGLGIGILAVLAFVAWTAFRPAAGEAVPIMANAEDHVPAGSDPGPFNSDPPTSGQHYGQELDAGFYEESDPEVQSEFAEGYLLHNLEHGYTIFWYNCDLLDEANCSSLKSEIKGVMGELNNFKVIGFPRSSIESPLVMTSWGRMLPLDTFNAEQAHDFIRRNRNRAPEPNAP
ncbi:MAG: DUF3105 domain-containing protein [Anaerolineales bacterium]